MYQEAASAFFAKSTFIINGDHKCDPEGLFIGRGLSALSALGSQIRFLKKVNIDLDTLCPMLCQRYNGTFSYEGLGEGYLHAEPLLRMLWRDDWSFDVVFVGHRRLGKHSQEEHQDIAKLDADVMTDMIRTLRRDELGIKKWMDIICMIGVRRDGTEGFLLLRSTHDDSCWSTVDHGGYHPCVGNVVRFEATKESGLQFQTRNPLTFLELPELLRRRILWGAFDESEDNVVSFDVKKEDIATVSLPSRFLVNRQLRGTYYTDFNYRYWYSAFEFVMYASTNSKSISDFQALQKWLCSGSPPDLPYSGSCISKLGRSESIAICLNFNSSDSPNYLSTVKFDAIPLILATAHLSAVDPVDNSDHVLIRVIVNHRTEHFDSTTNKQHTFSLKDLRNTVLRALLRIGASSTKIRDEPCSPVYINGFGAASKPLSDRYICKNRLAGSGVRLKCDLAWFRHDGPFDGSTSCIMRYLWDIYTGGKPHDCARKCEYNSSHRGEQLELTASRLPPLKHMRISCKTAPGPSK